MKRAPRKNLFRLDDDAAEGTSNPSTPEAAPPAPPVVAKPADENPKPRKNRFRDDGDEPEVPAEAAPAAPATPRKNRFRDYGDEPATTDAAAPVRRKNRFRDYGPEEGEERSPTEVDAFQDGLADDLEDLGDIGLLWSFTPSFAAYLRRAREKSSLSLRQASQALGVSYAYLARLETGGPARAPDMPRLFKMAEVYGLDRREILREAGFLTEVPKEVDLDGRIRRRFVRMVTDDNLRPALLTEEALHYIPDRLKQQWIEFARKLVAQPDPAAYLAELLADADGQGLP